MDARALTAERRDSVWLENTAGSFDTFKAAVEEETKAGDWPSAAEIASNIPIYAGETVRQMAENTSDRLDLLAEWNTAFESGPGVIAIRAGMPDTSVVDQATAIFERIIEAERASGSGGGDHFAKPGANDRVWNAAQKHCLADPANFAAYYASDGIAMAARAWLGRGYQLTAQVNRVNPGGAAQTPHRDYHLGFMNADQLATYPVQAHRFSPGLTLQGAVAHCDMPLETGPTMLLPYSQRFLEGYVAYHRPEFQEYFAANHVQVPLQKGDLLFFNPAVFHAAGTNQTKHVRRMANLLQVSSCMGRAMERMDRRRMTLALFPALTARLTSGQLDRAGAGHVVAASAEGYPFPADLDIDQPIGGLAPPSQAELVLQALDEGWSVERLAAAIGASDPQG